MYVTLMYHMYNKITLHVCLKLGALKSFRTGGGNAYYASINAVLYTYRFGFNTQYTRVLDPFYKVHNTHYTINTPRT